MKTFCQLDLNFATIKFERYKKFLKIIVIKR